MSAPEKMRRSLWSWCRCSFRWLRIASLALVLIFLAALTWLRISGLPGFLRDRIVAELAQRGVAADFSSLRFHWFRGFVASDLRVAWGGTNGPRLTIAEADLDIAPPPWRRTRELVRGLAIRSGDLVFPLRLTNEPSGELRIDHLAADIRFPPGDVWIVRRFAARTLGVNLELRATITNVSALGAPRPSSDPAAMAHRIRLLRGLAEDMAQWSAPAPPKLTANLTLDGAHLAQAHGDAYFEVPELKTPRGEIRRLRLSLRAPPLEGRDDAPARASLTFEFDGIQTAQGGTETCSGRVDLLGPPRPALPTNAAWQATLEHVFLRGFRARQVTLLGTHKLPAAPAAGTREDLSAVPVRSTLRLAARRIEVLELDGRPVVGEDLRVDLSSNHRATLEPPDSFRFDVTTARITGTPGSAGPLHVAGQASKRPEHSTPTPLAPDLGWWAHAWPYSGELQFAFTNLDSPKLRVSSFATQLRWRPPILEISQLEASLYSGKWHSEGTLDVRSRAVRMDAETTFDLHGIDALLGPRSRENFARYQWRQPPWFKGSARATLPAWTDRKPDWERVVKPTVRLDGHFKVTTGGGFKGVPFDQAESSLHYDGANWRLPDLVTVRPEGRQHIAVDYNEDSREYRIDARGRVFPPVLRPLIGEKTAEMIDLFEFPEPVDAVVSVWGPWTEGTKQSIVGSMAATNFVFRSQHFDELQADFVYTNRFLSAAPVRVRRQTGELVSAGAGYDFEQEQLWLTNTVSTITPAVVAAAISPGFPEKLVHYRFDTPPRVRVDGTLRPRESGSAQMDFEIEGGPFHFWRFSADRLNTRLQWTGNTLTLTNIQAEFYRGKLEGDAFFDLADPQDSPYRFSARVRDSRLEDLLVEATRSKTNVARGDFDLDLDIRSARTSDLWTWSGEGRAVLRDGLLWDAPIFGFLSPVLNAVAPGLGYNRAKHATATFAITNGVFLTKDLDIACPPAKLLYRGTIDLDQRVNAKVEGQVLTDFPAIGPLVGLLLRPLTKLMEFRVTGTLSNVEAEPVYVPKFVLLPLQPFKVIRQMFKPPALHPKTTPLPPLGTPGSPATNALPSPTASNPPPPQPQP